MGRSGEPEFLVQRVRIVGCECEGNSQQVRMRHHGLHQCSAEASAAEFRQHEHILQVRERGPISDDAGECDLGTAQVAAEARE